MKEIYKSQTYTPAAVVRTYVRHIEDGNYLVLEVNKNSRTIRRYATDGAEIPGNIKSAARERAKWAVSRVRWR